MKQQSVPKGIKRRVIELKGRNVVDLKKKLLDLEHLSLELSRKKQKEKREATFFHP